VIGKDVPSGQVDRHGSLELRDTPLDPVAPVLELIATESALSDTPTDEVIVPDDVVVDDVPARSWHDRIPYLCGPREQR
jgi:hypothetical protein